MRRNINGFVVSDDFFRTRLDGFMEEIEGVKCRAIEKEIV